MLFVPRPTCKIYVKTNKSLLCFFFGGSTRAFRTLGRLDGKVHSHRSCLLPPSWENLRVLTPTELGGCETTSDTQSACTSNNGHTHTYCCVSHPPPFPPLMDGLLRSAYLACGLSGLRATTENSAVFLLPGSPPYLMSTILCCCDFL